MSYEKVLCGSPDTDSTEEPPQSLYSVELEESTLRLKKKSLVEFQRPLAETVNIEDQIMNDDEIARVNNAVGDSNARRNFEESEGARHRKFEKSASGNKAGFTRYEGADRRWIDLNLRNPATARQSSGFELNDRESVIKRRKLVDSESDDSRKKDDGTTLQCDENIDAGEEISRPIYEGYSSENESEKGSSSEQKPFSLYYYSPHMVGVTGPSAQGILHPHMARSDFRSEHGRPEQQVPVASTPNVEQRGLPPYGLHGPAAALQFMSGRPGFAPANVAVVPSLGPVRFVDERNGMYYAIPMGADSSQYENFASSFLPVDNILRDASQTASSADLGPQNQEKSSIDVQKLYTSSLHRNTVSPSSSSDDRKSNASPVLRSDHGSPAPATVDDSESKGGLMQKGRGKPKALGGRTDIKCDQCGKTFGSSSALAKHKLTHSDERRYVCSTCGKGFKRQDHLNGHMVTHRDKKPYECNYQDCDKSYCDMRSLRRHLENHHASEVANNSGTSSTASPGTNVNKKPGNASASSVEHASLPRNCHKPLRGKPGKERGSGGDVVHVVETDSGKSSGRSTPGSIPESKAGDVMPEGRNFSSRKHNSDSFSSVASDDTGEINGEQRPPEQKPHHGVQEPLKPKSAVDLLKQAAVRAMGHHPKQPADAWHEHMPQQHPYMVYHHEGIPYQQWYSAVSYSQDPRLIYQYHPGMVSQQVYQFGTSPGVMADAQNAHSQGAQGRMAAENEMIKNSMVGQGAQTATSAASLIAQRQGMGGTPTDAMAIALATAKDMGQYKFNKESYYSVHPSGTQWQQVQYADLPNSYENSSESIRASMGNVKTVAGRVASPENNRTAYSDGEGEFIESYSRGTQCRNGVAEEGFEPPPKRLCPMDGSGQMASNSHSHKDKSNDGVFRNPAEILPRRIKQRPRPEPLTIPASVSTAYHSNRPGSPHGHGRPASPPYTPPPMLSPRSIFSHLSFAGNLTPRSGGPPQLPMTPSRLLLSSRNCRTSLDHEGDEEQVLPEPKINIGPQFQAEVPPFAEPKEYAKYDVHKATLCWKQLDERKRSRREEIESFLDMACSVAVIGGSTNKEYALHILHRCKGNVKEAVKSLLNKKYVIGFMDPLYDYHYEGSSRWAAKERQLFRNSFRTKGKEFADLQKDVGQSKTVGDCVEFYYLWKSTHPEAVRGRTRYIDSDSEEDDYDTGSETNSNPSLFECDFPHCNAKFVSRQALNGHIRVHGGSFMKPSEPRKRNKNPASTVSSSTSTSSATTVVKKRKPSPAPAPPPVNEDGTLPEFVCKVCGRIFHKIKSRSAHMKTHVKRPDDDEKAMKLGMKH